MTEPAPMPSRIRGLNFLLAATSLLSACLLFQVQPMVARRILPWFGGGAAVWTTALLFFQAALFIGYLYAHLVARSLPPRKQAILHVALLAIAAALVGVLGVLPGDPWKPESSDRPAFRILVLLAACVGLPYLMLAATAPLVQVWFSRANPGRSPYRLYAISNIGSLAALLSYPLLIEPGLGLQQQGLAWSALFMAFALVCAASAVLSLRAKTDASALAAAPMAHATPASAHAAPPRYMLWLALPACAVVLLMAITTHISQNVAPIPMLWILPMVAYLLSFILTFDSDRWYRRRVWMPLAGALSLAAVITWLNESTPDIRWMVPLHVLLLLAACMVCHGELARMRPAVSRLTAYYLCIAGGGALGGLFVGVVAPAVLSDQYELHLGLLAAWALAIVALVTDRRSPFYDGGKGPAFAGVVAMGLLLVALTSMMIAHVRALRGDYVTGARNFYGVLTIITVGSEGEQIYELTNGHIAHGVQAVDKLNHRVPMWYYHMGAGIGKTLIELKNTPPRRIGVVGLGTGTLATYGEQGDRFQFYDVNPQVADYAENFFTFLKDARNRGCDVDVRLGDARLVLERQAPQDFDLLVLDAFNGDSIPVHLLTMEAAEHYLRHLDEDGILAVHTSNQYLDLKAVVKAIAERHGMEAAEFVSHGGDVPLAGSSSWILLHRREGYFSEKNFGGPLANEERPLESIPWTDDYSNVLGILSF